VIMGIIGSDQGYPLTAFGEMGERWVVGELRRRGYVVEWIGGRSAYDLLIEGYARAEVKSATLAKNALRGGYRWQFNLRRHGLLVDEDVLFLLCWEDLEGPPVAVFVVPGSAVYAQLSKIEITSRDPCTYRGRWSRYREDWGQVRQVVERLPARQRPLFRRRVQERVPF